MKDDLEQGLDVAVTHLNAPVGPIVSRDDLRSALRSGSLSAIQKPRTAALLTYLFVELDASLIMRCIREAQSTVELADKLYQETLQSRAPRSINWERSVAHLL